MLCEALKACGLRGLSVDVNSVGCGNCRPAYLELLKAHLRAHETELGADSRTRLEDESHADFGFQGPHGPGRGGCAPN